MPLAPVEMVPTHFGTCHIMSQRPWRVKGEWQATIIDDRFPRGDKVKVIWFSAWVVQQIK